MLLNADGGGGGGGPSTDSSIIIVASPFAAPATGSGGGGGTSSSLDDGSLPPRPDDGGGGGTDGDGKEWRARFAGGGGEPIALRRAVDVVARFDSFDSSASSLAMRLAERRVLTGDGDTRKRLRGVLRALGAGDRNFGRGCDW